MLQVTLQFKRVGLCHPIDDLPGLRPTAGSYLFRKNFDKNIEVKGRLLPVAGVRICSCEKGRQIDPDIRQRPFQGRFKKFVVLPLNKIGKGDIGVVPGIAVGIQPQGFQE